MPVNTGTKNATEPKATEIPANLTAALAAVQGVIPVIAKDKTVNVKTDKGQYSYKYADLASIQPALLPLLAAQGLTWVTLPTMTENGMMLRYTLSHVSGEKIEGLYPLPDARTRNAQEVGSAITYARRYTFCCVIGVVPDEDEDGSLAVIGDVNAKEEELERERARAQARREEQEEERRQNEAREAARLDAQAQAIKRLRNAHDALYPEFKPKDRDDSIQRLIAERKWDRTNPAHLMKLAEELEDVKIEADQQDAVSPRNDAESAPQR